MGHVLKNYTHAVYWSTRSQPFKRGETDELQYVRSRTLLRDFLLHSESSNFKVFY